MVDANWSHFKCVSQVHLLIDQINAAIVDFNKAVTLQPNFPVAYVQKLYTDYRWGFHLFLIQKFNCLWNAELQTLSGTRWLSTRFWISSTRRWKSSPSRQKYFFLQIIQWQQMIFSCQVCGNLCPLCSGVEWPAGILLFMTSARKRSYKLSFMSLCSGVRQSGCFVSTGDEGGPWECKSSGGASRI